MLPDLLKSPRILGGAVGLLIVLYAWRRVRRWLRRKRPTALNPNLAKYGDPDADVSLERQRAAEGILATSSTAEIAGYELIRQVEAVYVDGFRHPEEALQGLKAAAALKGANALTHVGHTRSASGRCAASGDAVVVRLIESEHDQPSAPE